jgi:HD superfamily phosphohydrolase
VSTAAEERHHKLTLEVGQDLQEERYRIVHDDGNVEPAGEAARPIDSGGAGQVFRATNDLGLHFAIKVLNPSKSIVEDGSEVFHETFEREISLLAGITHTRLSKILDAGTIEDEDGGEVPYYVMDLINGIPFQKFLEQHDLSGRQFLALVDQILEGVEFMHARYIMHCDLKSGNILVADFEGEAQATIVDLGVAKVVKSEPEEGAEPPSTDKGASDVGQVDEHKTYFVSSESITREEWRPYLNTRIARSVLEQKLFPQHDLYGIGVLIENALTLEPLQRSLKDELGETGVQALSHLAERLTKTPVDRPYYESVSHLRRDWRKLDPRHLAPVGIPELAVGAQAKTSVATPNGRVSLTDRTLALINHPAMQRLRLVPQLELVSLVYPGATHTRLLHSLSTYDMTRRCVLHLLRDPAFRLMVDSEEIEALLLMALCHDIGHYPLSHVFEDFAEEERRSGGTGAEVRTPTDDDLFYAYLDPDSLVGGPFEKFGEVVSRACSGHPGDRVSFQERVFSSPGGFTDRVRDALHALDRCQSPSAKILRGLISSSIDADKLAYLSDDSAMTGVRYGLGIDVDAYLGSLRTPSAADLERLSSTNRPVVALNDKGLPAAESVMLNRYWMLKRVYWHHTNRAAIAMAKYVIAALKRHSALDMANYIEQTMFANNQDALAILSERFSQISSDDVNPLIGLSNGNRWLYKRVLTFAKGDPDDDISRLYGALAFKRADEANEITDLAREALREAAGREVRPGEVLLDVPVKEREFSGSPVLIYLRREPEVGRDIGKASPLIERYGQEFDQHVRKCRIFVHPQLYQDLGDKLEAGRAAIEEALRGSFGTAGSDRR